MKVRIKELYTEKEDIGELSMGAPVASIVLIDEFNELLFESFLTRSQYEGIKQREKEYQDRRDHARNCKTVGHILSLYGVSDYE